MEPASPLKSIATPSIQQQAPQQPTTNGSRIQTDSLAVLKSIQLTPPAVNNRQHRTHHLHQNGFSTDTSTSNSNFFNQQTNHLNGTTNGHLNSNNSVNGTSSHNGSIMSDNKFTTDSNFVADFSKASIYNSNNSLNSTGSGNQVVTNGTVTNGDVNANFANFADFENNKIYNAAGKLIAKSSIIHRFTKS